MGMRRPALLVLVLVLVLSILVVAPTAAKATSDGVCTGWGTMVTANPITFASVTPTTPANTAWSFAFNVGTCVDTSLTFPFLTATGVFTGWCDLSSGYGVTSNGHRFAFVGVGPRLFFTGEVVGEIPFLPDPLIAGNSCASGAKYFFVGHGATLLWNCKVTKNKGTQPTMLGIPLHHKECV